MVRLAALALALLAPLALVACRADDGERTSLSSPPAASGYFVGEGAGVGAAVDLEGRGAGVGAIRRSLGPSRPVAVAAVVNRASTASRVPGFRAVLDDGSTLGLGLVAPPVARGGRPAPPPRRLPARGARTLYLVFPEGAPTARTVAVRMSLAGMPVATLRPRPR